jgi:hypothetical protein
MLFNKLFQGRKLISFIKKKNINYLLRWERKLLIENFEMIIQKVS